MLKVIDPTDRSIRKFTVYKQFTVTQADSGSFTFGLECISGSVFDFNVASAPSRSYTITSAPYSQSFFKEPLYYQVKKMYYSDLENQYATFGSNDTVTAKRELGNKVNIITIPQNLFGEQIKPNSIKLTDNSTAITFDIRDDGYGNLYDWAYSSSYAAGTPNAAGSGSQIGNVFYSHGILAITNSGSYNQVGLGEGTDGFEVDFQSTHTIYEHEYNCIVGENEFNRSINISATLGYSGSITVLEGSTNASNLFAPGNAPDSQQLDPSLNELNLAGFYSQSKGYAPEYVLSRKSSNYNTFVQDTDLTDPFGTFRNPVFKSTDLLVIGNHIGYDINTLYKNKTYTYSIYLKWSGSGARQEIFEFDIANIGINGTSPGLFTTYVNGVQFTGSLESRMTTDWKRFHITAKHISDKKYHFTSVGNWFDGTIAAFTAVDTTPSVNQVVFFSNQSQITPGSGYTWTWSVSGGTYAFVSASDANTEDPYIKFTESSIYTISLLASDPISGDDTLQKVGYINTTGNSANDWDGTENHYNTFRTFLWSCPQVELGSKLTKFVNDVPVKIIQPPITEYQLIGQVTHSDWAPYITTIGLYNDFNQLVAIGKLSRPIRNDPELTYNLVVRFDT